MSTRRIYLDYASTTPLDGRVWKAMTPFVTHFFGNPSSLHAEGVVAKKALDTARVTVARCLEAHPDEIIFTSGGTEANNLAILGTLNFWEGTTPALADSGTPFVKGETTPALAESPLSKGVPNSDSGRVVGTPPAPFGERAGPFSKGDMPHVVTTNIEHASVLEPLRELERQGKIKVTYVPVESDGIVKAERIVEAIRPETILVSVMYANNEIGTIQPIAKIGKAIRNIRGRQLNAKRSTLNAHNERAYPLFHCDACQAPLYLNCFVNALGVDLMTLDGHKMYGPKGVGALYVRRGTPVAPMLLGGGQERGLRSTTENVPGIVGFAEALRIAVAEREKESTRLLSTRDSFCALLSKTLKRMGKEVVINGSMERGERLPNNLNISLPGVRTEFLTLQLDANGVAVSTKSSCLKEEKESYVVKALLDGHERAKSSIRFTLGRQTATKDITRAVAVLKRLLSNS